MCGIDYCQTCLPDSFLADWTEGKHHKQPKFGDYAQQRVAVRKRLDTYMCVLKEDPERAFEFPEFLREGKAYGYLKELAGSRVCAFARIVGSVPGFAEHVTNHPHAVSSNDHGRARRTARKNARLAWKKRMIIEFILKNGNPALIEVAKITNWNPPPWLEREAEVQDERLAA